MDYDKQVKAPSNIGTDISYDNPSFKTPYQEGRTKDKIIYGTGLMGKPKFVLQTITTGTGTVQFYAPTEKPD